MLDARAELREHVARHVLRRLRDEEDADALGADEADRLRDRGEEGLRRVPEEQVRFVEEEHELGLVEVADLGEHLVQLREQIHQERRVQLGSRGDVRHLEEAHDPSPSAVVRRNAVTSSSGSPKKVSAAGGRERDEFAQDDPRGRPRQATEVLQFALALVAGEERQHRTQVGEVDEREPLLVGVVEHQTRLDSCVAFRPSTRLSSSGPNPDTVARTGTPEAASSPRA